MGIKRLGLLVAALWMVPCGSLQAQEPVPDIRLKSVGLMGVGFYQPGSWGIVRVTTSNRTDYPVTPLVTLTLDGIPNVQFTRRLWVPPGSYIETHVPIFPETVRPDARALGLSGLLIDDSGPHELELSKAIGLLPVRQSRFDTAMMADLDDEVAKNTSTALRAAVRLPPTHSYLRYQAVPSVPWGWEAVDGVVICRHDPHLDGAQTQALRQWLIAGGKIWIMLDDVKEAACKALLGDDWDLTIIDRVSLTDFTIEGPGGSWPIQADYPVDMVRVTDGGMEVLHTVQGYPVSMRRRIGRGTLLVTTLHAQAWVDRIGGPAPPLKDLTWFTKQSSGLGGMPLPAAVTMRQQQSASLQRFNEQQIGHSVLSRGGVVAVLSIFAAALLVGGLLLARREQLAQLGWYGALMAIAATVVLIWVGRSFQSSTKLTIATVQMIKAAGQQPYVEVVSRVSIYTPPKRVGEAQPDSTLRGTRMGTVWPDLRAQGSDIVRLAWTDFDNWEVRNVALHEGAVTSARMSHSISLDRPLAASVRFTEKGLTGDVQLGPLGSIEDPVIVTPFGKLAPHFETSTRFTAGPDDVLGPGEFFETAQLTQTRSMRKDAYEAVLKDRTLVRIPSLLGWVDPLPLNIDFSDAADQREAALVMMSLRILRPAPGTRVTVPSAFLKMTRFKGAPKLGGGSVYDPRSGTWVQNVSHPSTILMRFDPPQPLKPLTVERAILSFDIRAPGWSCEVVSYRNGSLVSAETMENPLGPKQVELSGDLAPVATEDGAIVVGLNIGGSYSGEIWSIRSLSLDVTGTIAED